MIKIYIITLIVYMSFVSCIKGDDVVGLDIIGQDDTLTSYTGGWSTRYWNDIIYGQPAVSLYITGDETLTQFRTIVFTNRYKEYIKMDSFDYHLQLWKPEDYLNGMPPTYDLDLGNPINIELQVVDNYTTKPTTFFGNAGKAGGYNETYDLLFDLESYNLNNLESGEWVAGFHSNHNTYNTGFLHVSGSKALFGSTPFYSRTAESVMPRSIFGNQNEYGMLFNRWAMQFYAEYPENYRRFKLLLPEKSARDVVLEELTFSINNGPPTTITVFADDWMWSEGDEIIWIETDRMSVEHDMFIAAIGSTISTSLVQIDDAGNRSPVKNKTLTLYDVVESKESKTILNTSQ